MNPIAAEFNRGFGNAYFINRDTESVERTFMEKINDTMTFNVTGVKVTPVDELHDKLSLSLKDGENVEGVLSWRKSSTGAHYVLNGFT